MKGSPTTPRGTRAPAINAHGINLSGASKTAMARPWRMWAHAHLTASRWRDTNLRLLRRIDYYGCAVDPYYCGGHEEPDAQRDHLRAEAARLHTVMERITRKIGGDWSSMHDLRSPHSPPPTPAQYSEWMEGRRARLRSMV